MFFQRNTWLLSRKIDKLISFGEINKDPNFLPDKIALLVACFIQGFSEIRIIFALSFVTSCYLNFFFPEKYKLIYCYLGFSLLICYCLIEVVNESNLLEFGWQYYFGRLSFALDTSALKLNFNHNNILAFYFYGFFNFFYALVLYSCVFINDLGKIYIIPYIS